MDTKLITGIHSFLNSFRVEITAEAVSLTSEAVRFHLEILQTDTNEYVAWFSPWNPEKKRLYIWHLTADAEWKQRRPFIFSRIFHEEKLLTRRSTIWLIIGAKVDFKSSTVWNEVKRIETQNSDLFMSTLTHTPSSAWYKDFNASIKDLLQVLGVVSSAFTKIPKSRKMKLFRPPDIFILMSKQDCVDTITFFTIL